MGIYGRIGGGTHSHKSVSQTKLRDLWPTTEANRVFNALVGVPLMPYVGKVLEVFEPPRSFGLHFQFADGTRDDFVSHIDPTAPTMPVSLAMRGTKRQAPLVPDDPGRADPTWLWRKLAAANGIGTSFRQEGTGTSLHVAYNKHTCDVHVDRKGFIARYADGRVIWELNGLLQHLTVDLLADKASWLTPSLGYVDKDQRPIFQATLAPWVALDLPSQQNGQRTELKIGFMFSGSFR